MKTTSRAVRIIFVAAAVCLASGSATAGTALAAGSISPARDVLLGNAFYDSDERGHLFLWTNVAAWRQGVWREETNRLRVQITCVATNTSKPRASVAVGSTAFTCDGYYQLAPGGGVKWELRDSHGTLIPPRRGTSSPGLLPARISLSDMPKRRGQRRMEDVLIFYSNGPPAEVGSMVAPEAYHIKKDDNYTLTARVVVYKFDTSFSYLDRVDLPSIATMLHLSPSP